MRLEEDKFCDNNCVWTDHHPDCKLSQQEPVAYMWPTKDSFVSAEDVGLIPNWTDYYTVPLYTTPPPVGFAVLQKPWRRLTDEDLANCDDTELKQALYWEQILKEKNT